MNVIYRPSLIALSLPALPSFPIMNFGSMKRRRTLETAADLRWRRLVLRACAVLVRADLRTLKEGENFQRTFELPEAQAAGDLPVRRCLSLLEPGGDDAHVPDADDRSN